MMVVNAAYPAQVIYQDTLRGVSPNSRLYFQVYAGNLIKAG